MRYIGIKTEYKKPFNEAIMYKMYEVDNGLKYLGSWNEEELIKDFELDYEGEIENGAFFSNEKDMVMVINVDDVSSRIKEEIKSLAH